MKAELARRPFYRNGISLLALIPITFMLASMGATVVNLLFPFVDTSENSLWTLITTMGGSIGIVVAIAGICGWTETGSLNVTKFFIRRDLQYLGLHSSGTKHYLKVARYSGAKKPRSAFIRWFAYSRIGRSSSDLANQFDISQSLLRTKFYIDHDDIAEVRALFVQEKKFIKTLLKQKRITKAQLSKGLPLATYMLISNAYDDANERALIFKLNQTDPCRVFMLNKLAETPESIKSLIDLPSNWLAEATGSDYMQKAADTLARDEALWNYS